MKGRFGDAVTHNFSRILYINKEEKSKKGVKEGTDLGVGEGKKGGRKELQGKKRVNVFMRAFQANSRGIPPKNVWLEFIE